jgi:hypothetical protein
MCIIYKRIRIFLNYARKSQPITKILENLISNGSIRNSTITNMSNLFMNSAKLH